MTRPRGDEVTKRTGLLRRVTRSRNVQRERDTTGHRIGTCSRGDRERSMVNHHHNGSRDDRAFSGSSSRAREIRMPFLLRLPRLLRRLVVAFVVFRLPLRHGRNSLLRFPFQRRGKTSALVLTLADRARHSSYRRWECKGEISVRARSSSKRWNSSLFVKCNK